MYYTLLDDLNFQLDYNAPNNAQFPVRNVPLSKYLPVIPGQSLKPFCGPGLPLPVLPRPILHPLTPWGTQVNPKTPTVVEWNYFIEQQVSQNMSIRVGYVGSHAYHNILTSMRTRFAPQDCTSPTDPLVPDVVLTHPIPQPLCEGGNAVFFRIEVHFGVLWVAQQYLACFLVYGGR